MARLSLKTLYGASPVRAFRDALSQNSIDDDTHAFLLGHAEELEVDDLIKLFKAERTPECREQEGPLLRKLATLLPFAGDGRLLEVLRTSKNIDAVLWIHEIVLPLRAQLAAWKWYRLVDNARGGAVFNAVQRGIPIPQYARTWNPETSFVRSIEESRSEPFVVTLLDCAHNERECARRARDMLPIDDLLALHAKLDQSSMSEVCELSLETVRNAVAKRAARSDERWSLGAERDERPGLGTTHVARHGVRVTRDGRNERWGLRLSSEVEAD